MVFHVLNRGVGRMQLFEKAADFQAFERVLEETCEETPIRICAYLLMPNHWHLLLWPQHDGDLAAFHATADDHARPPLARASA
jgi:putative transposase